MPPRILVADDDQALQVLLKVILARSGFDVDFASTGREALRKVMADHYDAILTDLIFHDLSGAEILQRLKQNGPDSLKKVIVITAASRTVIEKADLAGVHALLQKPFDIADVIRLTSECVHGG